MTPDYHLADLLPQSKIQVVADAAGTVVAAGALTTSIWFPVLKNVSEVAATFLPFLGIILITLQIIVYVRRIRAGNRRHNP
jgi:hypothetical protein